MHRAPLALAFLAATAVAQTGTATAGNVTLTVTLPTATATTGYPTFNVLTVNTADQLYQQCWFYRIENVDPQEYSFRPDSPANPPTVTAAGPNLRVDFPDVADRGLLRAVMDYDIYSTGATNGACVGRLILTNISTSPMIINVYAYADFDLCGSGGDSVAGTGSHHTISDPLCVDTMEFIAIGNNRSDTGPYASIRNLMSNAVVNDLNNALPPMGPFDYTGAFQWEDRSLRAGETKTFTVILGGNVANLCAPLVEHYGYAAAGTNGVPTIDVNTLPLQSPLGMRRFAVQLANGASNSAAAHLMAFGPGSVVVAGLQIQVDLATVATLIHITNAAGAAQTIINVPPAPNLCGLNVHHQFLVLDPLGVGGFASYTTGLRTALGRL